ncbi:class I SAM-dependent methyltransferase [Tunturibacter empetritectus]|uniref:SAM-dependent methyltransferase n=1 Tax=Tunturiibacter empetritectus TaxID=3069691 RepID=A0A7W8IFM5_9BACT|nr:class I SAM-dependent methyltransferase [Edaphobacter lichenicola]MBB5316329.1 SAM-dependent methyltransferase [Edaphobacter lichenicola]
MLENIKAFLKNVPVLGHGLLQLRRAQFRNSVDYWDQRYRKGGDSGAGSYNRLAEFKANFLNTFVEQHHVSSVIEHGCGDGAQLQLARYPAYTGVDISPKAVEICRTLFAGDPTKRFFEASLLPAAIKADLALSLDVIYHLVEDHVFHAYMQELFASASRFVVVYSSNMTQDWPYKHVHHRTFTDWVAKNQPRWFLQSRTPNDYPYDPANPDETSFADFYVFAATS